MLVERGYHLPQRLGLELDVIPVNLYYRFRDLFPETEIVDAWPIISQVRMVKSSYEIAQHRKAAKINDKLMSNVPQVLSKGMTELKLASKLEAIARRKGHHGVVRMRKWNQEVFYGHLLTGTNALINGPMNSPTGGQGPHPAIGHGAGRFPINQREPILVDMVTGCGYLADVTRIFSLGSVSRQACQAHRAMLDLLTELEEQVRPGWTAAQLYRVANRVAANLGWSDNFMGLPDRQVPFVGHGIGLELDEPPPLTPDNNIELREGMVLAIEPKVFLPEEGVVGLEDTYILTREGLKTLSLAKRDLISI